MPAFFFSLEIRLTLGSSSQFQKRLSGNDRARHQAVPARPPPRARRIPAADDASPLQLLGEPGEQLDRRDSSQALPFPQRLLGRHHLRRRGSEVPGPGQRDPLRALVALEAPHARRQHPHDLPGGGRRDARRRGGLQGSVQPAQRRPPFADRLPRVRHVRLQGPRGEEGGLQRFDQIRGEVARARESIEGEREEPSSSTPPPPKKKKNKLWQ